MYTVYISLLYPFQKQKTFIVQVYIILRLQYTFVFVPSKPFLRIFISQIIASFFQPALNLLVVCVASFCLVFLLVFLAMVFIALKYKRKQPNSNSRRLLENSYNNHVSFYCFCTLPL